MLATLFTTLVAGAIAIPLESRQAPSSVPDYVTTYAPLVHLFSVDPYRPADIFAQLNNTHPTLNFTATNAGPQPLNLNNLNDLNNTPNSNSGRDIYLTSNNDPTTNPRPSYLLGTTPDANGKTENAISSAIITVAKEGNITDAFYFYFYAFDYGGSYPVVGNIGNHVGDWEHNMIRFLNGQPEAIWYSQHASGEAFSYAATQKDPATGSRPLTFSANGTHANYAVAGTHDHTIPGVNLPVGPVEDHTDDGVVWDVTASAWFYEYDVATRTFTAYGDAPVNWLYYNGQWGDDKYPESDPRQTCALGISALCRYVGGPNGPQFKGLDRTDVCPDGNEGGCFIRPVLTPRGEVWDDMALS